MELLHMYICACLLFRRFLAWRPAKECNFLPRCFWNIASLRIGIETIAYAHTVTFPPRTKYRNEARHLAEDWKLSNETWKFIGVFNGSRLRVV